MDGDVGDGQSHIDDADRREAGEGVAAQRPPADAFDGELAHDRPPAGKTRVRITNTRARWKVRPRRYPRLLRAVARVRYAVIVLFTLDGLAARSTRCASHFLGRRPTSVVELFRSHRRGRACPRSDSVSSVSTAQGEFAAKYAICFGVIDEGNAATNPVSS